MIADINLFGIFFDVALVTALVAIAAVTLVRRVLAATGAYRWMWHPPLVHLGLFAVFWLALTVAASRFQAVLLSVFG